MFVKKSEIENLKKYMAELRNELGIVATSLAELDKKFEEFEKIKEKLQSLIPREFTSTIRGFENEEDYEKFHNICSDIATRDETFKFEGNPDAKEIYLYSSDKNLLHKKSMWLMKKTNISGIKYTIR